MRTDLSEVWQSRIPKLHSILVPSIKSYLPSKVIFYQSYPSIKACLSLKFIFHQKSCSIKNHLSKDVFNQRLSTVKVNLPKPLVISACFNTNGYSPNSKQADRRTGLRLELPFCQINHISIVKGSELIRIVQYGYLNLLMAQKCIMNRMFIIFM